MPIAKRSRWIPVRAGIVGLAVVAGLAETAPGRALAPETSRICVSSAGTPSNQGAAYFAISATGRFVAFDSDGTNLTPGDGNGVFDVFVRDRKKRKTERVSVTGARSVSGSQLPLLRSGCSHTYAP